MLALNIKIPVLFVTKNNYTDPPEIFIMVIRRSLIVNLISFFLFSGATKAFYTTFHTTSIKLFQIWENLHELQSQNLVAQ